MNAQPTQATARRTADEQYQVALQVLHDYQSVNEPETGPHPATGYMRYLTSGWDIPQTDSI